MSDAIVEDEEVGYLILDDCEILLHGGSDVQTKVWLDVSFYNSDEASDDERFCTRGNLILEPYKPDSSWGFVTSQTPHFDGTIQDLTHSSAKCPCWCCDTSQQRSDASLLLGLARTCQDQGHIIIERIQILLLECEENKTKDIDQSVGAASRRAAFFLSFSMPWLTKTSQKQVKQRKPMPPSTQLLLALLRSDWDYPQSLVGHNKRTRARQSVRSDGSLMHESFFPAKLSLEELYSRIRGLQIGREEEKSTTSSPNMLTSIPHEVLQYHIAPFLRARTLNCLRCTSSDMNHALRAVVPGLKLRLYQHQITSLEWMRKREAREMVEHDILKRTDGDDDCHRSITAGASVLLRGRNSGRTVRLDTQYGLPFEMCDEESLALSRKVARGGLLCDDPGLGKTITVLSLILQTMGLSSEESNGDVLEEHGVEEQIFSAYWRGCVAPLYQRQGMNKVTKVIRRQDSYTWFLWPVSKEAYPDYYDVIETPMCFQTVCKKIEKGCYDNDFEAYLRDVKLIFCNAMQYNPADTIVYHFAEDMLASFDTIVTNFKEEQLRLATKSFSNPNARPNNGVAAILNRQIRKKYIESLIPSASTLLVVPDTLLNHWVDQILLNVDLKYCTTLEPVLFRFKGNDAATRERIKELRLNACVLKTHAPMIFVDQSGTIALPDPDFLALFSIVLTTTKRFVNEWKNGSFEEELKREDGTVSPYAMYTADAQENSACPLLKIHWTRMVVDEGHSMGRNKQSNAILFASWISANRRWSMTGTPTPQTTSRSGLTNLLGLMGFLKHDFFSPRRDGDRVWMHLNRSWNDNWLAAFYRVRALLSVLMIRHTKLEIAELPPPARERIWLNMSREEVKAYNTMVSAVQQNLFLTSLEGLTSGKQDSFLHQSQQKSARLVFQNLRLSSTGGYRVRLKITRQNWVETTDMLKMIHGLEGVKLKVVEDYMHRVVTEELSSCMSCGLQVMSLLILPCGDLICSQCMKTTKSRCCLVCAKDFDVDDFQRLQPGMEYEWYDEHMEAVEAAHEHPIVEAESNVGEDLRILAGQVALQPASSTRRTQKRGDGHTCEYLVGTFDGKCKLCHEGHDECVMIAEGSTCGVCHRISQPCPNDETKFYYLIQRLNELHAARRGRATVFSPGADTFTEEQITATKDRPLKVIVFSQYRKVLNLVGNRLLLRYGAGAVAEYWGSYRKQELAKFTMNRDCFCMLLSNDGSEGLDLSFVTNIFLLEELWDKSLEDQVIARAWRMGARGRAVVTNILARDSVESLMTAEQGSLSLLNQYSYSSSGDTTHVESSNVASSAKEVSRSKMAFVLDNVTFARYGTIDTDMKKRKAGSNNNGNDDKPTNKKKRVQFGEAPVSVGFVDD